MSNRLVSSARSNRGEATLTLSQPFGDVLGEFRSLLPPLLLLVVCEFLVCCSGSPAELDRDEGISVDSANVTGVALSFVSRSYVSDSKIIVEVSIENSSQEDYLFVPGLVSMLIGGQNYLCPSFDDPGIDMYSGNLCPGSFDSPLYFQSGQSLQFVELPSNDTVRCKYYIDRSIFALTYLEALSRAYIGSIPVWRRQLLSELRAVDIIQSRQQSLTINTVHMHGTSGASLGFVIDDNAPSLHLTKSMYKRLTQQIAMRIYNRESCIPTSLHTTN